MTDPNTTPDVLIEAEPMPQPGVVLAGCRVVDVHDADTITVEITRRIKVRFLNSWAPETKETKHNCEKEFGRKARAILLDALPLGTVCTVRIPTDGDVDFGDGVSFGRAVGEPFVPSSDGRRGVNVCRWLNAIGCNFETKAQLEAFLTAEDDRRATALFEEL